MKNVSERFWEKVKKSDSGNCWEWIGAFSTSGYGHIIWDKKHIDAHRLSYILNIGNIPTGMMILHSCNNKRCVNPEHLRLGTQAENMADFLKTRKLLSADEKKKKNYLRNQKYYYENQTKLLEYARERRRDLSARKEGEPSITLRHI
jgi:hypothetical protein